ncbi:unnamed protein product [Blepharisma stoltei]|uniref:Uncharacterized protein n=1 Tax=Blepharisma stoltei TaxID=1481888 RepID=A0AAU9JZ71_9CILI|nr:unnamed protein product [Blepharisma stoltei]
MKIQTDEDGFRTGKWSKEEHKLFGEGLAVFGHNWKKVAGVVRSRSQNQIRSHAQKYLIKQKFKQRVMLCKKIENEIVTTVDELSTTSNKVDRATQYGEGVKFGRVCLFEDYDFQLIK